MRSKISVIVWHMNWWMWIKKPDSIAKKTHERLKWIAIAEKILMKWSFLCKYECFKRGNLHICANTCIEINKLMFLCKNMNWKTRNEWFSNKNEYFKWVNHHICTNTAFSRGETLIFVQIWLLKEVKSLYLCEYKDLK